MKRLENLKKMFPEFFTEGKMDIPKLRQFLGEDIEEETERYRFTWAGKRDAIQLLQTPDASNTGFLTERNLLTLTLQTTSLLKAII